MERLKASMIVPAYNEEKRLPDCIAALTHQTVPFDEIIVVNNNSSDRTAEVAKSLGARVIFESNPGLSNARNAGAQAARTEVVCFVDADGHINPTWLEQALKSFEDPRVSAVSGLNIFQHENRAKGKWYNGYTGFAYAYVLANHHLFKKTFLVGNNLAIKKDVFFSLGAFKPVVGEDFRLSQEFWKRPDLKGAVNLNMISRLSSRRFDEQGYPQTIASWIIDTARRTPQVKYPRLSTQLPSAV